MADQTLSGRDTRHVVDHLAQAIVEGRTNEAYELLHDLFPERVPHVRVHHLISAGRAKDASRFG